MSDKWPSIRPDLKYPNNMDTGRSDFIQFAHVPYRPNGARSAYQPHEGAVIQLYMPNSTPGHGTAQEYEMTTFEGEAGKIQRQLVQAGGNIIGPNGDGNTPYTNNLRGGDIGAAAKQRILEFYTAFIGSDATTASALSRGAIYNPNVEMIYQGPQTRQFTFNFDFVPKDNAEAETVNHIIKEFKVWASPDVTNYHLTVPHQWVLKYFLAGGAEHPYMNKFKHCALTQVNVQENPQANYHSSFPDGNPVHTKLQLQFLEVDIIGRDDHYACARGF